eukprot:UN32357
MGQSELYEVENREACELKCTEEYEECRAYSFSTSVYMDFDQSVNCELYFVGGFTTGEVVNEWNDVQCYTLERLPKCAEITDPCDCMNGCGWSTENKMCEEGSSTNCSECTTMEGCVEGSCDSCDGEFDEMTTCQCTAECSDYGNCCDKCEVIPGG